jgi:hypothetical protein
MNKTIACVSNYKCEDREVQIQFIALYAIANLQKWNKKKIYKDVVL